MNGPDPLRQRLLGACPLLHRERNTVERGIELRAAHGVPRVPRSHVRR
ncbi:hypothetical protein ACFPK5_06605 [Streptomyces beijiangensis]